LEEVDMKRRVFLKETVLTAGFAANPWVSALVSGGGFYSGTQRDVPRKYQKPLPVLVLEGPPRKWGQIHGESMRGKIRELVSLWKDYLHQSILMHPDEYITKFLAGTVFKPAILKWVPEGLEETIGLSEGSGIDFKTIYAFQLMDEEWWFGSRSLRLRELKSKNCSGLGVFKQDDHPAMQAQNMDLPKFIDGFQTLLHVKHPNSSLESLIFTFAGFLGTNGLNNRPIGVCVNSLPQLQYSADGLPVAYIIRGLLERSSHEEAVNFIRNIKHASGQNYIIGGKNEIFDIECSAHSVSRFIPYECANRVYHTNHPLVNEDQYLYREIQEKASSPASQGGMLNSEIRFQSLEKRMKDPDIPITVDMIESILSSHDHPKYPVCLHKNPGSRSMTFGSTIMVLSPTPEFRVAPGPPCMTEFKSFRF
jgi:hypothetical protein